MKGRVKMKERTRQEILSELNEVERLINKNDRQIFLLNAYKTHLCKKHDRLVSEAFNELEKGYNK